MGRNFKFEDLVEETFTTTGTGDITLAGASDTGLRTFNSAIGVGPLFIYAIGQDDQSEWEIGIGYLSGTTTLVRHQVRESSNSNALVSFSAGTKKIRCVLDANTLNRMTGKVIAISLRAFPL